jgi:TatD DNase family protein
MLIDSHCHLDFPEFQKDFELVLQNAYNADVKLMQTISTKISKAPEIIGIAEKYENIFCSVGTHPHEVGNEGLTSVEDIVELTKHPKVIGIGETGLDYYYEHSPKNLQQESFINHIKAAQLTGLPIIVHTRDADDDTIDILYSEMNKKPFTGLIHCFTSSKKLADKALELGLYISISGIVTFKNAEELRHTVKHIPLSRLIIETDSPYLAPSPHRGKRNEPAFVKHTAEFLASLFGVDYTMIAEITTTNFFNLFSKAYAMD